MKEALRSAAEAPNVRLILGGYLDSVVVPVRPLPTRSLIVGSSIVLGAGILTGLATLIGQGIMPGQWNTLVNSGAIWLVPVFLVGSRMPSRTWAAVAGAGTLLATVATYYGSAALTGAPISLRMVAFWAAVALVAGPLYGCAGRWWHDDRRSLRVSGLALLGGVLVAEGLYLVLVLQYYWSGWTMVLAGILAAILLAQRNDRLRTLVALPLPAMAAGAAYAAIYWLTI
jgi:uncharacterized protein DUF6518